MAQLTAMCPRCHALLREDTQFAMDMALYPEPLPQRRFVCAAGHSLTVQVPRIDATTHIPTYHTPPRRTAHICLWCDEGFHGVTHQKYCSDTCAGAADTERTAKRKAAGRYGLAGEALRRAKSITFAPRRERPYAPRPKGLNMKWV